MINKLKYRFIWINLSILLSIFFAIFGSTYYLMYQSGKNQAVQIMEHIAVNKGLIAKSPPKSFNGFFKDGQAPVNQALMRSSFTVFIDGQDIATRIISNMPEDTDFSAIDDLVNQVLNTGHDTGCISFNEFNLRYLIKTPPDGERLIVFLDRSSEIATLYQLIAVLISIGGVTIIILAIISYYLARWAVKPVAIAWERQQQFVADASHELKTPLAVIQTTTDVLLANSHQTIAHEQKWMDYIRFETARMSKLVNDLLYLAKVDNDEDHLLATTFDLSEAVIHVTLPFESMAFESEKRLDIAIDPDLLYYGDSSKLQQVVVILLDNALKHAPVHTTVILSLKQVDSTYQLKVSNLGEQIPKEALDKIFERFYRVDSSRDRETGGYGLGLSIAKSIVSQHHGKIQVTSLESGLTTFCVTLPLKPISKHIKKS